jgi:hypothetical protein
MHVHLVDISLAGIIRSGSSFVRIADKIRDARVAQRINQPLITPSEQIGAPDIADRSIYNAIFVKARSDPGKVPSMVIKYGAHRRDVFDVLSRVYTDKSPSISQRLSLIGVPFRQVREYRGQIPRAHRKINERHKRPPAISPLGEIPRLMAG